MPAVKADKPFMWWFRYPAEAELDAFKYEAIAAWLAAAAPKVEANGDGYVVI